MVVLAAAALTAAGVGAYKGGQAVASDVKKRVRRHTTGKLREQERQEEALIASLRKEKHDRETESMTLDERLERFKKSIPKQSQKNNPKPAPLGARFRRSKP
jgi:uncharacterized protein HemX